MVPVDYVAKAMDHLAHLEGRDGEAFHLVNPEPQRTVDVVNLFAEAAEGAAVRHPDRPQRHRPGADRAAAARRPPRHPAQGRPAHAPAQLALRETVGRLGLPPEVVEHAGFPTTYGARVTEQALAGSGISVPDLESYAALLWNFWEEQLDDSLSPATRRPSRR